MTGTAPETGPVQVVGEVLGVRRSGLYHHLTLVAPGVPERFRPGTFVAVTVGGAMSETTLRRPLPVHRVRPTGSHGGTVECVFEATDAGTRWLAAAAPGTPVDVVGPQGRPFALPKEQVTCVLVALGCASAPNRPASVPAPSSMCTTQSRSRSRSARENSGALAQPCATSTQVTGSLGSANGRPSGPTTSTGVPGAAAASQLVPASVASKTHSTVPP